MSDTTMKRTLLFLLFLLAGVISGSLLSELATQVSFLNWLCWGDSFSVGYPNPFVIDLAVFKLQFGFIIEVNIAKLICIILSIVLYAHVAKRV